jgi:putative transposase
VPRPPIHNHKRQPHNKNNHINQQKSVYNLSMGHNQNLPQRRSIRLPDYDYAQPGAYFVTVVAHGHLCIFGNVTDGCVILSDIGKIVEETWREIPKHFSNVTNEHVVIMPNHVHGVIVIDTYSVRARHASPVRGESKDYPHGVKPHSLGAIVGSFKSSVTKKIHKMRRFENRMIWHRNYYEHVIRDETDYQRVLDYIETNPQNWQNDPQYHTP